MTGTGLISPLGTEINHVFDKLFDGKSGISLLNSNEEDFNFQELGVHYAGQIDPEDMGICFKETKGEDRLKTTAMKFAEFSTGKAMDDVRI